MLFSLIFSFHETTMTLYLVSYCWNNAQTGIQVAGVISLFSPLAVYIILGISLRKWRGVKALEIKAFKYNHILSSCACMFHASRCINPCKIVREMENRQTDNVKENNSIGTLRKWDREKGINEEGDIKEKFPNSSTCRKSLSWLWT